MATEIGTAIIGRDSELAELRAGLLEALAGRGRLFLVAGEPGIGKTRLADQISVEARNRSATVLWGDAGTAATRPPSGRGFRFSEASGNTTNGQQLAQSTSDR